MITEALRRGAEVFKNVGCTGKTDIILSRNGKTLHVDVKTEKWDHKEQKFKSRGVADSEKHRALVNPETWNVRWPKGKAPTGWESFWS